MQPTDIHKEGRFDVINSTPNSWESFAEMVENDSTEILVIANL